MPHKPLVITLPEAHRYRALLLDGEGRVLSFKTVIAGDDADASNLARIMLDGGPMELWDRGRFIERFGASWA